MTKNPFRYFKTSREIIHLAVMMYARVPLSLRNVEDLLHERGIDICHERVRLWVDRFGPIFAGKIRTKRASYMRQHSQWQWHLDEVFVKINGVQHYLWRAVDHEGEVLESYVTKTRDKQAALTFMKKAMKRSGAPRMVITDRLRSRRERAMLRFRQMQSLQKFVSVHSSVHNLFNHQRNIEHRTRFKDLRNAALVEWRELLVAYVTDVKLDVGDRFALD